MGDSTSDWENYCRQEGLDTLFILSAMRKERKELRLRHIWREKINLSREWIKQVIYNKEEQAIIACMNHEEAHSLHVNKR
jgi:hypothetical protein